MKATDLLRAAKRVLPSESATFPPFGAFLAIAVVLPSPPPPLNAVNRFAVFAVRGEGIDGTALRIRNFPHSRQKFSAKTGAAIAAAAAVTAAVVAEPPFTADIVAIAIFVPVVPVSANTDSIIPILLLQLLLSQYNLDLLL
jgi:hypothetical protein